MTRRNLVVVRAGARSLHRSWLDCSYSEREFDVLVSYYSKDAFESFAPEEGVSAVFVKGGKWDGLFKTLRAMELNEYDYFWLPDDDIDADAQIVNEIFRLCRTYGLAIAQPALTQNSYFSHPLFLHCKGFRLRYTNYVEIMVPCLSRSLLTRSLPYFERTMSGFGLDYIWCRFPEAGAFRVAVLDSVTVYHTRPVGAVLRSAIKAKLGTSSEAEEIQLKAQFNLVRRTVPLAFAGILEDGSPVAGRMRMALLMCIGWWAGLTTWRSRYENLGSFLKTFRRQLIKRLEMGRIE